MEQLCGELAPDDGFDPRFDRRTRHRKTDLRKTRQLCRQVAITLEVAMAASHSPILRDLQLLTVTPAPNASHLQVVVAITSDQSLTDSQVMTELALYAGSLRSEVADAIQRRRTPELSFRCLPPPGRALLEGEAND